MKHLFLIVICLAWLMPSIALSESHLLKLVKGFNPKVSVALSNYREKAAALEAAKARSSVDLKLKASRQVIGLGHSGPVHESQVFLEFTIPIYDGGELDAQVQRLLQEREAARSQYFSTLNDEHAAAKLACTGVRSRLRMIDLVEQSLANLSFLREALELQFEKGTASLASLKQAELSLEKVRNQKSAAIGELKNFNAKFASLTGKDSSFCPSTLSLNEIKSTEMEYLRGNNEIITQSAKIAALEHALEVAKRKNSWKVEGRVSAGFQSEKANFKDIQPRLEAELVARLELGPTELQSSEVRAAAINLDSSHYQMRLLAEDLGSQIRNQLKQRELALQQRELAAAQAESLTDAISSVVQKSSLASASLVEELDLNSELLNVLIEELTVSYMADAAGIELERLGGRLRQ